MVFAFLVFIFFSSFFILVIWCIAGKFFLPLLLVFFLFMMHQIQLMLSKTYKDMGPLTGAWKIYQWPHVQNKIILLPLETINYQYLFSKWWTLKSTFTVYAKFWLSWSCASQHNSCDIMIMIALSCLEEGNSQHSSRSSSSYILPTSSFVMFLNHCR